MVDDSGRGARSTLVGAALAGLGALLVLSVLTVAEIGSPPVRALVAVLLGVALAQVYERRG